MRKIKTYSQSATSKICLSLAFAIANMYGINAHAAPASVNVTYGGVTYNVGMTASVYQTPTFNFSAQPWWNNYSLASNLSALVRSSFGTPNFNTMAPYFGYGINGSNVTSLYNNTGSNEVQILIPTNGNYWWVYLLGIVGGNSITNLAAYEQTLTNAGSSVSMAGANMPNLAFQGAHHRTLLDSGITQSVGNGYGMWATADAAHFNSSKSNMEITEVGLYKDIQFQEANVARIGLGVGQLWNRQSLMLDGHASYNGQYLLAEFDKMFMPHLEGSITAYYGSFDTKVSRNYQATSSIDTSTGHTNTKSTAVRLRLDMPDLASIGKFSLSPYAAYIWSQADVGAYREAGGSFPASYNGNTSSNNNLRVGVGAKTAINATTKLVLNVEAVHSIEDNASGTSGQIIGVGTYSVAGQSVRQNWMRLMADIDHKLSDKSLVTFGLNAGTQGGDPSYGGTVSYHAAF